MLTFEASSYHLQDKFTPCYLHSFSWWWI